VSIAAVALKPQFTPAGIDNENHHDYKRSTANRKVFYSPVPSPRGMSEGTVGNEKTGLAKQKSDLKDKLDLKSKLNLDDVDLGVTMPSTNLEEYKRVLKLARKPSREEFNMIAKVSMAGIGLIGTIGFIIYALLTELPRAF
jgi:protein transport protein SEC61 subunit gamma-like protein